MSLQIGVRSTLRGAVMGTALCLGMMTSCYAGQLTPGSGKLFDHVNKVEPAKPVEKVEPVQEKKEEPSDYSDLIQRNKNGWIPAIPALIPSAKPATFEQNEAIKKAKLDDMKRKQDEQLAREKAAAEADAKRPQVIVINQPAQPQLNPFWSGIMSMSSILASVFVGK